MNIYEWAMRWGVPEAAVNELICDLRCTDDLLDRDQARDNGETWAQQNVRVDAAEDGARLWRNNVGGAYTQDGGFVRYGLCNDSKRMNTRIKSSDLVGIRPVTIGPEHLGRVLGQFVAREVKKPGWVFKGTAREVAQERFLKLVLSLGGDAEFTTREWK